MKAAVVGSGAWGTALAIRLHKNGHDVTMWTFESNLIEEMETTRRNPRLPGAVLPQGLTITGDYSCVSGCPLVVMASPSFPARSVCKGVSPYLDEDAVIVSVTKGLENGTHLRMSQVVEQECGRKVVVLTGPTHAEEVAKDLPTTIVSACRDMDVAEAVQDVFMEVDHVYPDLTVHLTLFNASIAEGFPQKIEHNDLRWITVEEIDQYEFCPADEEILRRLKEL